MRGRKEPDPSAQSDPTRLAADLQQARDAHALTHDYKRHGTTSLFAALDAATGKVFGQLQRRRCSAEFLRFLDTIDANVPKEQKVDLITPTSASWISLVERFFALIGERHIKRGAHNNFKDLETSIGRYLEGYNQDPKSFMWTTSADAILGSIARLATKLIPTAN